MFEFDMIWCIYKIMNEFWQICTNSMWQRIQASIPNQQHAPNSTQITPTKGYQAQAVAANQVSR
jgi:hypothetical protein